MSEDSLVIRSQLIPIDGSLLILPNTSIAEVVAYVSPQRPDDKPEWFLGFFSWRSLNVPLVAFETINNNMPAQFSKRSRIVVLNTITGDDNLPFYGLLAQGIPRLMSLDASNTHDSLDQGDDHQYIMRRLIIEGQPALVPDQSEIESQLKSQSLYVN